MVDDEDDDDADGTERDDDVRLFFWSIFWLVT